jgi:hypothetical protein
MIKLKFFLLLFFIPTLFAKENAKVAFVTIQIGNYDSHPCRSIPKQTIPVDYICFSNRKIENSNQWDVDTTPYHLLYPCKHDIGSYKNSLSNNKSDRNLYKFYKMNLLHFPRMQKYDVIIWIDGTISVKRKNMAKWFFNKIIKEKQSLVLWEHHFRGGKLLYEAMEASKLGRYIENFGGQKQPKQDILAQYDEYITNGYNDTTFWRSINPQRPNLGVWVTSCIGFDNQSKDVKQLFESWYLEVLRHTTHDQVSFPYVIQQSRNKRLIPYTLPDDNIQGNFLNNDLTSMGPH